MPVVGDFPDHERMPGPGHDGGDGKMDATQQIDEDRNNDGLAGHHRQTHCRQGLRDARHGKKEHLRDRRIGGDGIVRPIDVGIDRSVSQGRQGFVGRHEGVGVDACGLHAAIPHVAIDIRGQERFLTDDKQPHRDRHRNDHDQPPPLGHGRRQRCGCHCDGARENDRRYKECVIVRAQNPGCDGHERQHQQPKAAEGEQRRLPAAMGRHDRSLCGDHHDAPASSGASRRARNWRVAGASVPFRPGSANGRRPPASSVFSKCRVCASSTSYQPGILMTGTLISAARCIVRRWTCDVLQGMSANTWGCGRDNPIKV